MALIISDKDIIKIINKTTEKYYMISWKMTNWCNYQCPYCIAAHSDSDRTYIKQEVLEQYAQKIKNFIDNELSLQLNNRNIKINLIGGEVTYYNLINIIKILKCNYLKEISITTNLSQSLDYFIELNNFCKENNIKLALTASYHEEFGTINSFIDKVLQIKKNNIYITVSTVITENRLNKDLINLALTNNLYINITKERDVNQCTTDLSKENLDELLAIEYIQNKKTCNALHIITKDGKDYGFSRPTFANNFISNQGFNPDGFTCTAGLTCLRIEPNGNVCRTGCYYLRNNFILGNLNDHDYEVQLPQDNIICHLDQDKKCHLCWRTNIYLKDDD
jgi:MoaA/NifB/PqqE/SkfB family radical SAM enzyme